MILDLQFTNLTPNKDTLSDIEKDDRPKQLLLNWCKDRLKNYKDVQVDNFQDSWQDGTVFLHLLHSQNPRLVDLKKIDKVVFF